LKLAKGIKINHINRAMIDQLIRSSTSVGANYCEAIGGSSRKDFRNKICICKKEAQETRYWLRLLKSVEDIEPESIVSMIQESHELVLIFNKIAISSNDT
jgi:four helix bundle protein